MQKLEVALRGANDFFIILFKKKNARAQRAPSNASPAYSSARSFCKSHLLSRYVSLALLLSVSLAQCISILLFRLFSLQVDPVRTNPPQSDQTGESFFLTGRFRNYSWEVCEFPPGRPVAHFMKFFSSEKLNFCFTTISPRFTYGGSILEGTRETHGKHVL